MKLVTTFIGLLCSLLQVWGLSLSWPGDGGIVSGQTIQLSFSGGAAPYILTVLGFNARNADNVLQTFPSEQGPNVQWRVSVPDGYVRFNVTDAGGGTIISYWQIVYPDPNIAISTQSVASTASAISAYSMQAYLSGLSTSAQAALTRPTGSQGGVATATAAPNSGDSSSTSSSNVGPIVGGVIGGVAGLLAIALFAFWWVRRSYPKSGSSNHIDDGTTTATMYGGWGSNATDKEPGMAQTPIPYNPYQPQQSPPLISPMPTTPIQTQQQPQHQPPHGIYGGLPEIQGGRR